MFSGKPKLFLKKAEYRFLLENTTIKYATFPYKRAFSKTNVKTNRTENTKLTFIKNGVLSQTYLFF